MKAQITSIKPTLSKYGGKFYYVFFKNEQGESYKTCLYPNMRNFARWRSVMKQGAVLTNLIVKSKKLIDADSHFNFIGMQKIPSRAKALQINKPEVIQSKLF